VKNYFIVEFRIQSRLYNFIARTEGDDMYAMIDKAEHKMMQEISREKERLLDERDHPKIQ